MSLNSLLIISLACAVIVAMSSKLGPALFRIAMANKDNHQVDASNIGQDLAISQSSKIA